MKKQKSNLLAATKEASAPHARFFGGSFIQATSAVKLCNSCSIQKSMTNFSKKGAGRFENSCKLCLNERRKLKRATTSISKKSLAISCELGAYTSKNWAPTLVQIIKPKNLEDDISKPDGLTKIFKDNNEIWGMLEKD